MKFVVIALAILVAASIGTVPAHAGKGPKIENKLGGDSTIFSMAVDGKQKLKEGSTFKVTLHVIPGHDWHVYSTKMSTDGGLVPLTLKLPDSISQYFELGGITETGAVTSQFDSNFMTMTMAHFTPYDVNIDVKVLKKPPVDVPFSLLVHFQTCNDNMCMPPRTFEVPMTFLGQQPITLKIAGVMVESKTNFARDVKVQ